MCEVSPGDWSRLVVPSLAVTEICHLPADPERRGRRGLTAEFCAAIADDELRLVELTHPSYRRPGVGENNPHIGHIEKSLFVTPPAILA